MFGIWALFFIKYCFYSKYEFISSGSYFSLSFFSPSPCTVGLPLAGPCNIRFLQSSWRGGGRGGDYCWQFCNFSPIQDTARRLQWAVSCSVMCLPGGKATVKWGSVSDIRRWAPEGTWKLPVSEREPAPGSRN